MNDLYNKMIEYMDYMDMDYKASNEELPIFHYSYFEIVQQLLLLHTHHSGGTSTRAKCQNLGFEANDTITFQPTIE